MPLMPPIPILAPAYLHSLPAPNTAIHPLTPPWSPPMPPIPLLVFNCCHFAIDCLPTVKNDHFLLLSFAIVITLQLTIFMSTSSLQDTIFRCQEYIFSAVKLSQFLQYLPKYAL